MNSTPQTTNGRTPAVLAPWQDDEPEDVDHRAADGAGAPSLTAIIPTVGRVSLKAAVRSVLRQSFPTTALVVLDRPEKAHLVSNMLRGLSHRLVLSEGGIGAAASRNLGVRTAATTHVAFLDDDDEWVADKAELQMTAAEEDAVLSARSLLVGPTSRVVPEELYQPGETPGSAVIDYVLDRSTLRLRRHFLQTSSLLCAREAALDTPWDEELARHQDWDWVVRLEAAGHRLITLPEVLVRVHQGSQGSISQSPDWQASSHWIQSLPATVSARARGDFQASIIARGAFASGAWWQGIKHLLRGLRSRCHPAALVVGLTGIMKAGGHGG